MDSKKFGRASLVFGFLLFLFNFLHVFFVRGIPFNPDLGAFIIKMLGAMAIGSSQAFYDFNHYLGIYYLRARTMQAN